MNPASQLIAYLNRGGQYGYYWLKEPGGAKRTIWFDVEHIPDVPDGNNDVYFGINPTRYIPKRRKKDGSPIPDYLLRATLNDLAAINCLFAEFDAKQFEGGKQEAFDHINSIIHPPSILVDSGGGYHAYWLLGKPVMIEDNLDMLRLYQARWVDYVRGDPDAKDLARVLRVPGTYNYKYPEKPEVKFEWADYDIPFYLEDLIQSLPERPAMTQPRPVKPISSNQGPEDHINLWVRKALDRVRSGDPVCGRNETGFWLACQLRDDGVSLDQARTALLDYQTRCPPGENPYTPLEAEKSVESAYSRGSREPARGRGGSVSYQALSTPVISPTTDKPLNGGNGNGNGSSTAEKNDGGHSGLKSWDLVYLDFDQVRECYDNQEAGDAELLARMYRGMICYDHTEGTWYVWKKHYWERDQTGFVYRLVARRVSPQYLHASAEAQSKELDDLSKNLAKRAAALRNKKRMDNVLFLAARHEHLALKGDEWDANPWLLGCANGVIELKTGHFRPGKPNDYIRSHSPVDWRGMETPCPRWELFLSEIFTDTEIPGFMRRLLGFGCSGLTQDHQFPILWGEGRNGKSTMLEVLGDVLGSDLATSSQADALMDAAKGGDGPKPFIWALRGKRLVWASESNEGRRINEGLVKQLTGGDRLNVRTLHSKPIEFKPSHLLMLLTNHKPHINADGSAIWDRVYLIPFTMRFVDHPRAENERKRDPALKETLQAELSGILAWLVRGFMEYQQAGINPPVVILEATQSYREEEDTTGLFISEKCIIMPTAHVRAGELYKAYSDWAKESGIQPMSITSFGKLIKKKYPARESHGIIYDGIGLVG